MLHCMGYSLISRWDVDMLLLKQPKRTKLIFPFFKVPSICNGCIWKLNFYDVHELRMKSFQVVTFVRKLCDITGNMAANETILVELLILFIQITLFGH